MEVEKRICFQYLYNTCTNALTSHVTTAGKFCLNDETRGTRVLQHVAPGVVGAIIRAADGAAHVSSQPRRTTGPWTSIAAGDTARSTSGHLGEARLPVPAPDAGTGRHF